MLFSVFPSAAVHTTCCSVNVSGWQLLRDLRDVPTVTISGVAAAVLSFDVNSAQVRSPVTSAASLSGSIVVTATQSGRVTTLPDAFTFLPPPRIVCNESFASGTITGNRWTSVGVQPWIVESVGGSGNGLEFCSGRRQCSAAVHGLQCFPASRKLQRGGLVSLLQLLGVLSVQLLLRTLHRAGAVARFFHLDDIDIGAGTERLRALFSGLGGCSNQSATHRTECSISKLYELHILDAGQGEGVER